MRLMRLSIAAVVALCASSALAGNPMYDSWAKHKPGTMVVMKGGTETSGMKTEMEQTYTLKEVTAEKVVVEMKGSMTVMGNKTDMPAQNMEIKADAPAAPTPPAGGPKADTKTHDEAVTVAGKEYKATCTETTMEMSGNKTVSKVWTSAEVPGMNLKMHSLTEGAMKSEMKMELVKVELK